MKHAKRVHQKIQSGEESEIQGLLEQWLRDGRLSELEALLSATDMFTAGVDSVRKGYVIICKAILPTPSYNYSLASHSAAFSSFRNSPHVYPERIKFITAECEGLVCETNPLSPRRFLHGLLFSTRIYLSSSWADIVPL